MSRGAVPPTVLLVALLAAVVVVALAFPAVATTGVDAGDGVAFPGETASAVGSGDATARANATLVAQAECELSDTEVPPGTEVTLNASGSANADFYEFDRTGDGTYEAESERSPTHAFGYAEAGTYEPQVRVTDAGDDTRDVAACGTLVVDENEPPAVDLTHEPADPAPGEDVAFDGSNTTDPDGDDLVAWGYDVDGDGTDEYGGEGGPPEPIAHAYAEPGSYEARLTVEDEHGGVGEAVVTVSVRESPRAVCTASPTRVEPGEPVTLDASATENASYVEFDADGDGQPERTDETDFAVEWTYEQSGEYAAGVTAYGPDRSDAADCGVVTVNVPPAADLVAAPNATAVGETVTFDASESTDSDGEIVEYRWDFDGDGAVDATTETPTADHAYADAGEYEASVTVVDDAEGTDAATATVSVEGDAADSRVVCAVAPESAPVGEPVTVDAADSEGVEAVAFDVDGDGTDEYANETDLVASHAYDEPGEYAVTAREAGAAAGATADCGVVTVTAPPDASLSADPASPAPGQEVTLDASGSSAPAGEIVEYRWDFDGDGTVDATTTDPVVTHVYDDPDDYAPSVTVADAAGGTAAADAAIPVQSTPEPTLSCTVDPESAAVDESVTVDASASDGVEAVAFDVDGDGTDDYTDETDLVETHAYDAAGEFEVVARAVGADGVTATCGVVGVGGGGLSGLLDDPVALVVGIVALGALGGLAWYLTRPSGDGDGGDRHKPPSLPPDAPGVERYHTGTFETPTGSETVTVAGLGFEPDLLLFSAAPDVRALADGGVPDRTTGWSHGRAVRTGDGDVAQTAIAVADDAESFDAAMGVSTDGHALELVHHYDDPPGRLLGTVTATTGDGFEMAFDASELRGDRADDSFAVLYRAFSLSDDAGVEVGHFRTPAAAGTQSIDLGIDANHVMLLAANAVRDVGDRSMTDLSVGFSYADVVGRTDPGQAVRSVSADPSGRTAVGRSVRVDRAIDLPFGRDGTTDGHTTATVTGLGERIDLRYGKRYSGPSKVGSTDSTLVSYVAVDAGATVPDVGYFRLPPADATDLLSVDVGFRPGLVEFTTVGLDGVPEERTAAAAPVSFDWSQGTVMATDDGLAQFALDSSAGPVAVGGDGDGDGDGDDAVAVSVRAIAESGHVVGRDDLSVVAFTDDGFDVDVTGTGTARRDEETPRPHVLYKAWPDPDAM